MLGPRFSPLLCSLHNIRRMSWNSSSNPAVQLGELMQVPLFPEAEIVHNPTDDEIQASQEHFLSSNLAIQLKKHKGVVDHSKLPFYDTPEISFVGASNAGKSSLIKAILGDIPKLKVPVSAKAGFTKALHLYQIGSKFTLVDMPGYGERMPKYYTDCVEMYLQNRSRLLQSFLLLDGSKPLLPEDHLGLDMMESFSKSFAIVITKIDNTSQHKLLRNVLEIQKLQRKLQCCLPQMFLTSAVTGSGIPFLRSYITHVTGLTT